MICKVQKIPNQPFDDDCSYLQDEHIRREQNVFDPEKRENTVALVS